MGGGIRINAEESNGSTKLLERKSWPVSEMRVARDGGPKIPYQRRTVLRPFTSRAGADDGCNFKAYRSH